MSRFYAAFLRSLAYGLIACVAIALIVAPNAQSNLGEAHWLVSLLPHDPPRIGIWIAIAALNAGGAFALAAYIEHGDNE